MGEEKLVVNLRRDVKVILRMVIMIMTLTSTTIWIMTLIIIVFFRSTRFVPDHLDDDIDECFLPGVRDM